MMTRKKRQPNPGCSVALSVNPRTSIPNVTYQCLILSNHQNTRSVFIRVDHESFHSFVRSLARHPCVVSLPFLTHEKDYGKIGWLSSTAPSD